MDKRFATLTTRKGKKLTVRAGTKLGQIRERFPHATLSDISNGVDYFDAEDELEPGHSYELVLPEDNDDAQPQVLPVAPTTTVTAPATVRASDAVAAPPQRIVAPAQQAATHHPQPQPTADTSAMCNACGGYGHLTMDCNQRRQVPRPENGLADEPWSLRRDREGQYGVQITNTGLVGSHVCSTCGNEGHLGRDCPDNLSQSTAPPAKVRTCFKCGSANHMQRDCPQAQPPQTIEDGVSTQRMPNMMQARAGGPTPERVVTIVDEPRPWHNPLSRGPGPAHPMGRGPMGRAPRKPVTCFQCGEVGHIARECPRKHQQPPFPRQKAGPTCHSCGMVGHVARNCTQGLHQNPSGEAELPQPPSSAAAAWLAEGEVEEMKFNEAVAQAERAVAETELRDKVGPADAAVENAPSPEKASPPVTSEKRQSKEPPIPAEPTSASQEDDDRDWADIVSDEEEEAKT